MPLPPAFLTGCQHEPVRASNRPAPPTRTYPAPSSQVPSPDVALAPPVLQEILPVNDRLISTETGLASWYGTVYNHHRSADGQVYEKDGLTAASRTLPLGTLARITNLATGQATLVRITDRGPFVPGRIIDLSEGAARATGLYRMGVGQVRVEEFTPNGIPDPPGRWCVQIGAFSDPADALQSRNDLLSRYPAARVITFKGPTGSWVRLTLAVPEKASSTQIAEAVSIPDPGVAAYLTRTD